MTIQHVLSNDIFLTGLQKSLPGLSVHVQDGAILGANGDRYVSPLKVVSFHNIILNYSPRP
jgi:hypothetical protein